MDYTGNITKKLEEHIIEIRNSIKYSKERSRYFDKKITNHTNAIMTELKISNKWIKRLVFSTIGSAVILIGIVLLILTS